MNLRDDRTKKAFDEALEINRRLLVEASADELVVATLLLHGRSHIVTTMSPYEGDDLMRVELHGSEGENEIALIAIEQFAISFKLVKKRESGSGSESRIIGFRP